MTKKLQNKIQSIIRKHYGKGSRFRTRGWEQCGREIEAFIRTEQDKVDDTLTYSEKCAKEASIRREIENEYESYFKVGAMYSWINGNNKLKLLLDASS